VPLAEARAQLTQELALQEASNRLPDVAARLDDELAAGTDLKEAARAVGLEAVSVPAVDPTGKDREGKPIAALPQSPEFMQVARGTAAGETSLLEETDAGGYFVVHVDGVVEPRLKPVDEVRDQLVQAWQAERRRELARQKAEELRTRLADGAPLGEVLAGSGLESKPLAPLRRDAAGDDQGVNRAVVRALFATKPGGVGEEVIELGAAFAVVGTDEVIAADPAANPEAVAQLTRELEGDMRSDLIAQFETQLRRDYPVEVDGAAINRLIGSDGMTPSAPAGPLPGGPL
jgi:peptidyl-prolyl cis-trans isomerase D